MEGDGMMMNNAEIDTAAPFRSVKEAVTMFGDRVIANELYANRFKEMQDRISSSDEEAETVHELEETKQSLQKAREESIHMARCLSSLQHELEQTKMELLHFKNRHLLGNNLEVDNEDLKFVEDMKREATMSHQRVDFHKSKYVRSANPPVDDHVIVPPAVPTEAVFQRHPSLRMKRKKQQLIAFIGGIFSKMKGSSRGVALA